MIKAIIFDIGGVVLKPKTFHPLAKEYSKIMGRDEEEIYDTLIEHWHFWKLEKIKDGEFFRRLARDLNAKADINRLREMMYSFPQADDEMFSLIKKLRNNYGVFALTNHAKEFLEFLDKKHNLNQIFDFIFASYEVKLAKPDQRIYEYVVNKIGLKPEECIFTDDRERNVNAAKEFGMQAIQFENPKQFKNEIKKAGVNF